MAVSMLAATASATVSVSETTNTVTATYTGTFTAAWQRHATGFNNNARVTFGYNTRFINEDYAWSLNSTQRHHASLRNGNGIHTASAKNAGSESRIEVRHSRRAAGNQYMTNR
jgi:hypothetical protein